MTKDKIKQGRWYETKLGVGECTRAGGTFPWSAMIDIKLPFPRGKLNFVPRDVLREVDAPKTPAAMPTRCDVCGASLRTHACDEEACEPTTPEDGPCVREKGRAGSRHVRWIRFYRGRGEETRSELSPDREEQLQDARGADAMSRPTARTNLHVRSLNVLFKLFFPASGQSPNDTFNMVSALTAKQLKKKLLTHRKTLNEPFRSAPLRTVLLMTRGCGFKIAREILEWLDEPIYPEISK